MVAAPSLRSFARDRQAMSVLLLLLLSADPTPEPTPAPPTATQPVPPATSTADDPPTTGSEDTDEADAGDDEGPELRWPSQPLTVAPPSYGLGVREVSSSGKRPRYRLTPQRWDELVEDDPRLAELDRRARLRNPGIALLAAGTAHFVISSALALDGYLATSALGSVFQWGVPGLVIATGAILTAVGIRARKQLRAEQQRLYLAPTATRQSAGATAIVRF